MFSHSYATAICHVSSSICGEPLCSPSPCVDPSPFRCGRLAEELIVSHVIMVPRRKGCCVQLEGAQMRITEMPQG